MVKLYLCLNGGFTQFPTHVKLCPKVSPWWNSFLLSPKGFMQKVKFCWCGAIFNVHAHETSLRLALRPLTLSFDPSAIFSPLQSELFFTRTGTGSAFGSLSRPLSCLPPAQAPPRAFLERSPRADKHCYSFGSISPDSRIIFSGCRRRR
jgi:hypothetical protein